MKFKDLNKIINFNQDLINIFTDYALASIVIVSVS